MLSIFTDFLNFTGQWVLSRLYLRFTSTFCIFLYWQNKSQICQNSKLFVFMLIFPVALLDAIKQLIWNTNTYQHKRSDNNCDSNNFFPRLLLPLFHLCQKCKSVPVRIIFSLFFSFLSSNKTLKASRTCYLIAVTG